MGYKKLLTNIVLGGVCLISLSFADKDETPNPDYAPLNTEERAMLLKIELQEKDHSLANLSYDAAIETMDDPLRQIRKLVTIDGVDVDLKYHSDSALLYEAAGKRCGLEIVQLLAAGVDPNARDDNGKTPLDLATARREETSDEGKKKVYEATIDELQSYAV
ncbi:MAG: hypothetical protein LBD60_03250 [Puniceicoccales bacterium]|jgi:ankyrin repeat protein|nr:hypothetical protein [Puniceicoccales bacterium]